jgi:hypothetical protein
MRGAIVIRRDVSNAFVNNGLDLCRCDAFGRDRIGQKHQRKEYENQACHKRERPNEGHPSSQRLVGALGEAAVLSIILDVRN